MSYGSDVSGMATPPNEYVSKVMTPDLFMPDGADMAVSIRSCTHMHTYMYGGYYFRACMHRILLLLYRWTQEKVPYQIYLTF